MKKDSEKEILETLQFIVQHMVTKDEFASLEEDVTHLKKEVGHLKKGVHYLKEGSISFREEVRNWQSKADEKFNTLFNMIDGLAKFIKSSELEHASFKAQGQRHESWIKQLAAHTDLELRD